MSHGNKIKHREPSFIIDVIQAVIASLAAVTLALDATGFLNLPWIQDNLGELTFIAICTLIVTSVFERRFILQSYNQNIQVELEHASRQLQLMRDNISGLVSADILLKDRTAYTRPLEIRLQNAAEVCVSGKTLFGFITLHKTLFLKHAKRGCKFRFMIHEPSVLEKDRQEIEQVLSQIAEIQAKDLSPNQVEVRLTTLSLPCSILMIDAHKDSGDIQVEFYTYLAFTSDRPHITLARKREPKWYEFYHTQFESLWNSAIPYKLPEQGS